MRRRGQAGFTLVEMLISLAIVGIVSVVLAETFVVGYTTLTAETRQLSADNAGSDASLWLTRDLQSSTLNSTLPVTLTPGSGSLSLSYGSPSTSVTYSIDANGNLQRAVAGGAATAAARGVARLTLAAGGGSHPACYLTVTLTPSGSGASARTLQVGQRVGGCF